MQGAGQCEMAMWDWVMSLQVYCLLEFVVCMRSTVYSAWLWLMAMYYGSSGAVGGAAVRAKITRPHLKSSFSTKYRAYP